MSLICLGSGCSGCWTPPSTRSPPSSSSLVTIGTGSLWRRCICGRWRLFVLWIPFLVFLCTKKLSCTSLPPLPLPDQREHFPSFLHLRFTSLFQCTVLPLTERERKNALSNILWFQHKADLGIFFICQAEHSVVNGWILRNTTRPGHIFNLKKEK